MRTRLSKPVSLLLCLLLLGAFLGAVLAAVQGTPHAWLSYLYFLSYEKLFISTVKFVPQFFLNYTRKSTIGWSIHNVLCDFVGVLFFVLQLLLDCWATKIGAAFWATRSSLGWASSRCSSTSSFACSTSYCTRSRHEDETGAPQRNRRGSGHEGAAMTREGRGHCGGTKRPTWHLHTCKRLVQTFKRSKQPSLPAQNLCTKAVQACLNVVMLTPPALLAFGLPIRPDPQALVPCCWTVSLPSSSMKAGVASLVIKSSTCPTEPASPSCSGCLRQQQPTRPARSHAGSTGWRPFATGMRPRPTPSRRHRSVSPSVCVHVFLVMMQRLVTDNILRRSRPPSFFAQVLFIRRAINPRDRWSGHVAFPGGRNALGEGDRACVEREVRCAEMPAAVEPSSVPSTKPHA